jgi:predicted TIM-barrel fold metal-dependent hydrolase
MNAIAVEEHFLIPEHHLAGGPPELLELGEARLEAMEAAQIATQVLLLNSPGIEGLQGTLAISLAQRVNDTLAQLSEAYPGRYLGFAVLPLSDPEAALRELERAAQLGLKGVLVNGHVQGRYLDAPELEPILARIEELGLPLYLHPALPPPAVLETTYGGFPQALQLLFAGAGWGWHVETAAHLLRLILAGTLDRHPHLRILVGHLGEGLPFMLPRLDRLLSPERTGLERPVSAYLREQVFYAISGFNFLPAFLNLLLEVGVERILFATDYPYGSMQEGRAFLDQLPLAPQERDKIAWHNAARLFQLSANPSSQSA